MLSMLTRPFTQLLSNRQLKSTFYLVCNSLWDAKSKLRSFEGRHVGNTCVLVPSLTALNKFSQEDWTCEYGRNGSFAGHDTLRNLMSEVLGGFSFNQLQFSTPTPHWSQFWVPVK